MTEHFLAAIASIVSRIEVNAEDRPMNSASALWLRKHLFKGSFESGTVLRVLSPLLFCIISILQNFLMCGQNVTLTVKITVFLVRNAPEMQI
jgi:hypothetical protein